MLDAILPLPLVHHYARTAVTAGAGEAAVAMSLVIQPLAYTSHHKQQSVSECVLESQSVSQSVSQSDNQNTAHTHTHTHLHNTPTNSHYSTHLHTFVYVAVAVLERSSATRLVVTPLTRELVAVHIHQLTLAYR